MRERVGVWMTYCGSATAAGCGAQSAIAQSAPKAALADAAATNIVGASHAVSISLSDIGIVVGIAVGVVGLLIQGYCALSRRLEERELHKIMKRRLLDPATSLSINDRAA